MELSGLHCEYFSGRVQKLIASGSCLEPIPGENPCPNANLKVCLSTQNGVAPMSAEAEVETGEADYQRKEEGL